ncbi:MAG: DUF2791 family P-loop domain-containing protein, partial [Gemmatimonadota bacterium]|nr:DUF2791 family P-loop domain-containing protein [Gemmatimonadota bacterium]
MADTLPLVGRADEIAMLQRMLADASEGRGSAIFVAGEGGVGKTRLATTIAASAAERGWATAIGRAYPVETGVPYAVFSDAMMPLLRELDQSALTLLTRGGASELTALFPALAFSDRAHAPARGDPSEIKTRLLWNFAQFLGRYAAKKPLLLVLENLQWADSSSLELLHFVARQLGTMRVAVVCTYNEMERDQNPSLRTTESSLVSLGAARAHALGPLTRPETDALLREAFGAEGGTAREFAALLYGWTRGNPFFLEEVLGALVDTGTLYQRDGSWHGWEVETMALPASIREALIARVSRLSPASRALADVAAVIGTRASYDALRTVSTAERRELLAALDELRSANVLVESESAGGVVYDFAHPMVRAAIYGELGLARARQLHATVAESLERFHGQRAPEHADELAFHFARANAADLTPKAIRYLVAAGRAALKKHANREGANYLSAALELADRSGSTDADADRADGDPPLIDQLARARQRLGEYDAALALWERALSDATTAHDDLRVAGIERRMGLASYWRGRHQDALGHYERGIAAAERAGNVVLAARLLIATGVTYVELGRPTDGEREIQRALAVAESRKDSSLMARAHRALLLLHAWTGSPERAREHGAQAIGLSRESDQLTVEW